MVEKSLKRCDVFSKHLQLKWNSFTDSSLKSTVQILYDVSLSGGIGNKDEILKDYITIHGRRRGDLELDNQSCNHLSRDLLTNLG